MLGRGADDSAGCEVSFDREQLATTGRMWFQAAAPVARLAPLADPRSWRFTSFFPASDKVHLDESGAVVPDVAAPAPGASWRGLLYEHFRWANRFATLCEFANLLNIDFDVGADSIVLGYSLNRPLHGRAWFSRRRVGVDVDSGFYRAQAQGDGTTRIEMEKKIRFIPLESGSPGGIALLNRLTAPVLRMWMHQVVADARAALSTPVRADGEPVRGPLG
jgi:hypothetical protein